MNAPNLIPISFFSEVWFELQRLFCLCVRWACSRRSPISFLPVKGECRLDSKTKHISSLKNYAHITLSGSLKLPTRDRRSSLTRRHSFFLRTGVIRIWGRDVSSKQEDVVHFYLQARTPPISSWEILMSITCKATFRFIGLSKNTWGQNQHCLNKRTTEITRLSFRGVLSNLFYMMLCFPFLDVFLSFQI